MKIQCYVCSREEASVFCSADEAALCHGCDCRVHHANKLASKHHRFSLLHPSSKEAPRCDICQERRAFLFCLEDRAILCRECDLAIHTANDLTKKHSRFLLTGIKLSSSMSLISISSTADESPQQAMKDKNKKRKKKEAFPELGSSLPAEMVTAASSQGSKNEEFCTSIISEYLIKTPPGWHVDDLLTSAAPADCLLETDVVLPFTGVDDLNSDLGLISKDFSIWVPQVAPNDGPLYPDPDGILNPWNRVGLKDFKDVRGRHWGEDGFSAPEMCPPFKRSRPLW